MRRVLLASFVACLIIGEAFPTQGDAQAELRAIIDKAVKARGGAEKLSKFKAAAWKGKGKFYGLGEGLDITGDWAVQPPGQSRTALEFEFAGMKFQRVAVVNGDKGWVKLNDMVEEMDKEQLAEEKAQAHTARVTSLLVLSDKGYELAPLGDAKVGERPAVGVKVAHKDQRDVSLFFDKESGLLLKSEARVKDARTGQEFTQATLYDDYREVAGIKHPMKLTIQRDGKVFVEVAWSDFQPQDRLDDSVFGKP